MQALAIKFLFVITLLISFSRVGSTYAFGMNGEYNEVYPKGRFELRMGGGLDFILLPNANIKASVYPYDGRYMRFSLEVKGGIYANVLGDFHIQNYYPAVRLHRRIAGYWFTLGIGREFNYFHYSSHRALLIVNQKLDFGIKIYEGNRHAFGINIPLRIDDELPWFFTGINFSVGLHF